MKTNLLRLPLSECEISNMHSLLDRLVYLGYGCFGVDFQVAPSSYINLSKLCIDKEYILFCTIFRHVALLVTEISHQNQNFRIIPRMSKISEVSVLIQTISCTSTTAETRAKIWYQ